MFCQYISLTLQEQLTYRNLSVEALHLFLSDNQSPCRVLYSTSFSITMRIFFLQYGTYYLWKVTGETNSLLPQAMSTPLQVHIFFLSVYNSTAELYIFYSHVHDCIRKLSSCLKEAMEPDKDKYVHQERQAGIWLTPTTRGLKKTTVYLRIMHFVLF